MNLLCQFSIIPLATMLATVAFADPEANSPAPALRAMVTDRPSLTDGPFTLDAGHTQFEFEFFTHTHDDETGVQTNTLSVASTFVRWGITPQFELQLGWQTYAHVTVNEGKTCSRMEGFGDTLVRAKYNFWGNDSGNTAFSLLPFVKIPTNSGGLGNRSVEPGCSLPFIVNLPVGWQLGFMARWSRLLDANGRHHHNFWEYSVIAGHNLTERLTAYGELWTGRSSESDAATQSSAGFGLGYTLSDRMVLDASVNLALNRATTDLGYSFGYSIRF